MPPLRSYIDPFQDVPSGFDSTFNPYLEKVKEDAKASVPRVLYGPYLRGKKSHWLDWFHHSRSMLPTAQGKLIVEIGSHDGAVMCSLAAKSPHHCFVGLDITLKRVHKAAMLAKEQGLANVAFAYANARAMSHLFAAEEIHSILIFFPDPWQKKMRQRKHRLLDASFCKVLYGLLQPKGSLWFKTDAQEYFLSSDDLFKKVGFITETHNKNLSGDCISTFEKRFRAQNKKIFQQHYQKL